MLNYSKDGENQVYKAVAHAADVAQDYENYRARQQRMKTMTDDNRTNEFGLPFREAMEARRSKWDAGTAGVQKLCHIKDIMKALAITKTELHVDNPNSPEEEYDSTVILSFYFVIDEYLCRFVQIFYTRNSCRWHTEKVYGTIVPIVKALKEYKRIHNGDVDFEDFHLDENKEFRNFFQESKSFGGEDNSRREMHCLRPNLTDNCEKIEWKQLDANKYGGIDLMSRFALVSGLASPALRLIDRFSLTRQQTVELLHLMLLTNSTVNFNAVVKLWCEVHPDKFRQVTTTTPYVPGATLNEFHYRCCVMGQKATGGIHPRFMVSVLLYPGQVAKKRRSIKWPGNLDVASEDEVKIADRELTKSLNLLEKAIADVERHSREDVCTLYFKNGRLSIKWLKAMASLSFFLWFVSLDLLKGKML